MKLTYRVASLLAKIAELEAELTGVPMAISIVDDHGEMIFFGHMDNTLPVSREIAVSKAYTSAVLRMDTRTVGELSHPGQPLYGIQNTHGGRLILFGGGLPLSIGEQVVGAVGISGGSVEEDEQVAHPVREAFASMVSCAAMLRKVLPAGPCTHPSPGGIERVIERRSGAGQHRKTALILTGAFMLALDNQE